MFILWGVTESAKHAYLIKYGCLESGDKSEFIPGFG